ncbi:hypothetical protein CoNPh11_CDS0024 [Staphylococcus phage S-CoN_Ph11]|nr:hypothetical protein CoNPh11_CDS0024 [Staphylococcus phage S-CoN_Ph11]
MYIYIYMHYDIYYRSYYPYDTYYIQIHHNTTQRTHN